MTSVNAQKALEITAPFTNGTDDTNVLLLSMGVAHAALALPDSWAGRWVTIQVYGTAGKSAWFLTSKLSTAEVDRTVVAAADGNPGPTLGKRVQVGETVSFRLPKLTHSLETLYLINETDDATTTAEIWLSSD